MARKRSTHRRRRGSLGPLLRVLSVLLTAVAVVTALTLFFKVGQMEVTGNVRYTAEEILTVTGVEEGDNLVLLDKYGIARKLYTQLPYITDVHIDRKLPDKLVIEVTETGVAMAIRGAGSWWLLTSSGKLLEPVDSASEGGYPCIKNAETQEPVVGGRLQLAEESVMSADRLLELMKELDVRGMLGQVDEIDLGDAEKLVIGYDGRFRVEMYYDVDFDFKLNCLAAAVAELEPNETGIIRMTMDDDNEVRFIPYEQ